MTSCIGMEQYITECSKELPTYSDTRTVVSKEGKREERAEERGASSGGGGATETSYTPPNKVTCTERLGQAGLASTSCG